MSILLATICTFGFSGDALGTPPDEQLPSQVKFVEIIAETVFIGAPPIHFWVDGLDYIVRQECICGLEYAMRWRGVGAELQSLPVFWGGAWTYQATKVTCGS